MKILALAVSLAAVFVSGAFGQSTFFKKYPQVSSSCGYSVAVSTKGIIGLSGLQFDSSGSRSILQSGIDSTGKPAFTYMMNTGSASNAPGGMAPVRDGGFILVSSMFGADGKPDIIVTRLRPNGTLGWKRRIGTTGEKQRTA